MSPPIFYHRTNNLWTLLVIIKANFAFLLSQCISPTNVIYRTCLVKKLIQKRLNINIQHSKMDPFCGRIIAQISPKMHRLAYKISKNFPGVIPPNTYCRRGQPFPHPLASTAFNRVRSSSPQCWTQYTNRRPWLKIYWSLRELKQIVVLLRV